MNVPLELTPDHLKLVGETPKASPIETFKKRQLTKGLLNPTGYNNCFLNVVIQALFQLKVFRSHFHEETQHAHNDDACIYCILKDIFINYEFSESIDIDPNSLRKAMAFLYQPEMKFQLEKIDDAGEALEAVLESLHKQFSAPSAATATSSLPVSLSQGECSCLVHRLFGLNLSQQTICGNCRTTSSAQHSTVFNLFTYTFALLNFEEGEGKKLNFGKKLKEISRENRTCSNEECGQSAPVYHKIHSPPSIVSIGVVWATDQPEASEIGRVVDCFDPDLKISDVFDCVTFNENFNDDCSDNDICSDEKQEENEGNVTTKPTQSLSYRLAGMLCYYGQHYSAFFYHEKTRQWFSYDDTSVRPIGPALSHVREKCVRGKLQPCVLFYQSFDSQLQSTALSPNPLQMLRSFENQSSPSVAPHSLDLRQKSHIHSVKKEEEGNEIKEGNEMKEEENEKQGNEMKKEEVNEMKKEEVNGMKKGEVNEMKKEEVNEMKKEERKKDISANQKDEQFEENLEYQKGQTTEKIFRDFSVLRTNWMYRQQERIFRVKSTTIERIDPTSREVRETFKIRDVRQIEVTDKLNCILYFYANTTAQYLAFSDPVSLCEFVDVVAKAAESLPANGLVVLRH